ncbi:hypothetical protein P3T27_007985 [Kitasatospora sp. MAA19]|uniref:hypothetical protein n=1 Tax=unclassified Kitasatospora TaxID=2633591 RepID=UPI002475A1CF|nr:hypothetical protein [Kitasatospora sp. MAA19]MDH6711232.1 hypothetical protein [Kitasatospora sp. MAA19]
MSTYLPHRPTPPGTAGSWRDARRAPADEVEQAAGRERAAWSPAVIRVGGTWIAAIVTAWRPLENGRWAARVIWGPPETREWIIRTPGTLRPAELRAALPDDEGAR